VARLLTILAVLLAVTAPSARADDDPTTWTQVGSSLTAGDASGTRMAAVGDVPWVVYTKIGGVLGAAHWDGTAWQATPPVPIGAGHEASGAAIADVGGVPYVSWSDFSGSDIKVRVARWTGAVWELVGGVLNPNLGYAAAIAGVDGVPYVALQDAVFGTGINELVVKRWSGTAWETVGAALVDDENVLDLSITAVGDEPVVAWSQETTRRRVYAAHFNGTAWAKYGGELNHAGEDFARAPTVTALNGAPAVAWLELDGTDFSTRVARWNGTSWADMGGDITTSTTDNPASLVEIDGVPWLATVDGEDQIAVARWDGSGWQGTIPHLRRNSNGITGLPSLISYAGVPFVSWFELHGEPADPTDIYAAQYGESAAPAQLHLSEAEVTVDEADGTASLAVERTGNMSGTVSVHFATADGTASSPPDYGGGSGTVTFGPGETAQALTVSIVDDGTHEPDETFTVTLSEPSAGAEIDAPDTTTVTITDDDPIDTLIDSGPDGYLPDLFYRFFLFHADPPAGATFTCAVDGAAAAACTSPFDPGMLPEGQHTVSIRAGTGGVQDPTPATRSFFVDTVRPVTSVTAYGNRLPLGAWSGPVTVRALATDPEPGSGVTEVRCAVDPAAAPQTASELRDPCPVTVSSPGAHTVYAAAVDRAGHAGIPAKTAFTITAGPDTLITSGPDDDVYGGPQRFTFMSSPMGAPRFQCRIDGGPPTACNGSYTTDALGAGTHVFSVAAVDTDGLVDGTPATRTYRVRPAATTTRDCDVMLPRDKGAPGDIDGSLYPTTVDHTAGYGRRGCNAEFAPCPAGALCTLSAKVSLQIADRTNLDYFTHPTPEFIIHWTATANVQAASGRSSESCTIFNTIGTADCVGKTATQQVTGPSNKLVASCVGLVFGYVGDGQDAWGPDDKRRLHCDITLKIEPIKPFTVTVSGTGGTTYMPGPGALTIAAGKTGSRALRATKPAKRTPAVFKTIRRTVKAAGPVAFKLTLSKAAKRQLLRRHRLVVTLRQTFTPTGGSAKTTTKRVTLRTPAKRLTAKQVLQARCKSKALQRLARCKALK
jgi:hypothetical protein